MISAEELRKCGDIARNQADEHLRGYRTESETRGECVVGVGMSTALGSLIAGPVGAVAGAAVGALINVADFSIKLSAASPSLDLAEKADKLASKQQSSQIRNTSSHSSKKTDQEQRQPTDRRDYQPLHPAKVEKPEVEETFRFDRSQGTVKQQHLEDMRNESKEKADQLHQETSEKRKEIGQNSLIITGSGALNGAYLGSGISGALAGAAVSGAGVIATEGT